MPVMTAKVPGNGTSNGNANGPTSTTASALAAGWTIVATLLAPVLRLNLRRRAANGREIAARLPERRGIDPTPRPAGPLLWMHAASVGETMSILPVLEALRHRTKVLLTTGTVTSQALLDRRIPEQGLSNDVLHRFAPLDVPSWVARFLSHWRPDAACFVESELWPNQLAACQAMGIPLMLVNADFRREKDSGDRLRIEAVVQCLAETAPFFLDFALVMTDCF